MTIYVGPVGRLQALPYMGRGIEASHDIRAAVHQALAGARTVDLLDDRPRRTFRLQRRYMSDAEMAVLQGLALGTYGPGPYVLLHPWQRNLLTPNQSSGTDVLAATTGFRPGTAVPGATVTSTTLASYRGTRSLGWGVTANSQELFVSATTPGGADVATDVPVIPGQSYRFSAQCRLSATSGSLKVSPNIRWYDRTGTIITSSYGTGLQLDATLFSRVHMVATAPTNAAVAVPFLGNYDMGSATTIYCDAFVFAPVEAAGPTNMFADPSLEAEQDPATGTVVVRTNLMANPVLGTTDTSGWGYNSGTGGTASAARQTGQSWGLGVATSYRATWSVGTSTPDGGVYIGSTVSNYLPVTAGKTYSFLMWARCSKAQRLIPGIVWLDSGGSQIGAAQYGTAIVVGAGAGPYDFTHHATAPANAVRAICTVYATTGTGGVNWAASDYLEASLAQFEESDVVLTTAIETTAEQRAISWPFNGWLGNVDYMGMPTGVTMGWSGTAHASTSYLWMPALTRSFLHIGATTAVHTQTSERAQGGRYASRTLWGTGAANTQGLQQVARGLKPYTTYRFSVSVYVPTGSPNPLILSLASDATYPDERPTTTVKDQWVRLWDYFYTGGSGIESFYVVANEAVVRGDDRLYTDDWMLSEVTGGGEVPYVPEDDAPGLGAPRVAVTGLSESFPIIGQFDGDITLTEVQ